jgi:hypothetical protein
MATLSAFNQLMQEFLSELSHVFPERSDLALYSAGFPALCATHPEKPLKIFLDAVGPYSSLLMGRNDALFDQPLDLGGIDIHELWHADGISANTRDAMWKYISTLFLLGSTMSQLPPNILNSIEAAASDCAAKIQNGELNMSDLTSQLFQSMSSLMSPPREKPRLQ